MKQVAQNYKSGELAVLDVPVPACKPGGVLIRSLYSLISTGTEMMKVSEARLSLLGKARARPDQVRKLLDSVAQQGALATYQKAMNRLDSYTPLGYSLCGTVIEVGAGAEQFSVGQVVAAAGNEFALHAEVNWVPVNLCVPVPDGVAPEHAAFATVGAIAMQGVRRAEVALGESACVIGLGLIGQIVVRLLVASGVHVVGLDTVEDRCLAAEKAGALVCAAPDDAGLAQVEQVLLTRTGGLGADHVLLAAGGDSNGPVEVAARLARDRARVVDIGKTKLDLPWNAYYEKELDVRFSRSYGPGRYDDRYELEGIDYPAGYVRWTERRNLACFLDLLADGSVDVAALVSGVHPVEEAADVYDRLGSGALQGVGFLLGYRQAPADEPAGRTLRVDRAAPTRPPARRAPSAAVRLGFIGAGNYATSMLLPHLRDDAGVELVSVATTTSLSGVNAQRKFGFATVTTDVDAVLDDDSLDGVVVVTRHHSHAGFVCRALERGHAVFVEKPLALTDEQLDDVLATVEATGNDRVMVGFNRRFAPLFGRLQDGLGPVSGPLSARYLVNAGGLAASSWYLNEELEGSRFAGEGGHFIDTLSALVGQYPVEVHALGAGADVHAGLRFADGSVATISYVTGGNPRFPKETLDVAVGGRSARLDNFQRVTVWSPKGRTGKRALAGQDKGQGTQLDRFVQALRAGGSMPIPLDSLVATTRATLAVGTSLATRRPVSW
ncbi:MAG TPA: bi-domain-containing oxidoreductase [Kineosporiaceae bacterium]|jgi:predicted dehydrogenase/threonine dehydrogenase-like Zn-dependent dehydrogenase|nr:bi-domain-containing oxidoreductase [Kineosporiaceae bacterium]